MSKVGQRERATQSRVVKLFQNQLDYDCYGDWQDRADKSIIEEGYLRGLHSRLGVMHELLIGKLSLMLGKLNLRVRVV